MKPLLCYAVCLLLLSATGCGGSNFPDPVPVSGAVTYQGKPVEGARVTFLSQSGGRSASGTTDASGNYLLTTFNTDDGAIPDDYTVTIAKFEKADAAGPMDGASAEASADYDAMMTAAASSSGGGMKEETALPEKYADAAESGLTRTVAEGQPNQFNFELK